MIIDENLAVLRTHGQNIDRYRRLLQTNLTALERDFIERRIVEEQTALDDPAPETVSIVMALSASKAA
jgi:hypothetical protein